MKIESQITELLAIKLYEHDGPEWPLKTHTLTPWLKLTDEDREIYRALARGEVDLPACMKEKQAPPIATMDEARPIGTKPTDDLV